MPIGILYEEQFKSIDSDAPGDISLEYVYDTHSHTHTLTHSHTHIYLNEENFKYIKQKLVCIL
jgi:hypothetical protein